MDLNGCIKKILESFEPNDYFDSHTVINELIRNPDYHIHYIKECPENLSISLYHKQIAEKIRASDLVKEIGTAKSHTIYGEIKKNKLWQKNP